MEKQWHNIGDVASRAGVAASTLRFYEEEGFISGRRSAGGRRQYSRDTLRRIAFIRAAQAVGLALPEIAAALASLPEQRTPTKADWSRLAKDWGPRLDAQIEALQLLRRKLDSCIGCGCLSMKACALYNPQDAAAARGAGARYLLGDTSAAVLAGTKSKL
ncbi:MAG: redox-sensitive transcriptional activator SoxR [Casimicrobium sp.]